MEFHTLAPVTNVDIAGVIIDYTLAVAAGKIKLQPPAVKVPHTTRHSLSVNAYSPAGYAGF